MVASTSVLLNEKSQEQFIEYYKSVQDLQNITRNATRDRYTYIDKTYQRELDLTTTQRAAKQANKLGDPTRFQNIIIPVVAPQVETGVVYQTSVFLTGDPIFGVVAAPAFMDEALQLETILENNSIKGGWARQLMLFFRDGLKYNFAPIEVSWDQEVTYSVETNLNVDARTGQPKEVIWSGNSLKRLDPYNTFIDTRVSPTEFHKTGEFGGYTRLMSRIALKTFIAALPDKIIANVVPALESGLGALTGATDAGSMNYYTPNINSAVIEGDYKGGGTNWLRWASLGDKSDTAIQYKDMYEVTTLYARILPSEFSLKVPKSNTPQIYKLIIINHQWIIYAELQTNAHNYIPILIGQPLEDGLDYQTKSLATNGTPFQELATAYMASIVASRRRSISDRVLYDQSRITSAQMNNENPSAKIPVRPSAYGSKISDAVYAFPYNEDQQVSNMQQIQAIIGLANSLNGQNQASQGQFVKGNKTLAEFEDVMQNANGRDQAVSILLEFQVFAPMKEILKLNTLQFQAGVTLFNRKKNVDIEIDPVALRKAILNFRISDGLIPSAKIINAEALTVALQSMANDPELSASYNRGPLFSYLMKTQGAELTEFEKSQEQIAYEQAFGAWQGLIQLALEKNIDPAVLKLGPQPLPEQFGYDPAENTPTPPTTSDANTSTKLSSVENIGTP